MIREVCFREEGVWWGLLGKYLTYTQSLAGSVLVADKNDFVECLFDLASPCSHSFSHSPPHASIDLIRVRTVWQVFVDRIVVKEVALVLFILRL